MTEQEYIKKVMKQVKCIGSKRSGFKKELTEKYSTLKSTGLTDDEVISKLGSVQAVTEPLNSKLSGFEKGLFKAVKIAMILLPVAAVIALMAAVTFWVYPRPVPISESTVFTESEVEEKVVGIIDMLDAEEYDELKDDSIPELQKSMNSEVIGNAKASVADDFGQRLSIDSIEIADMSQMGKHSAVSAVEVTYEKAEVTYTITIDSEGKLAGIYMRKTQ